MAQSEESQNTSGQRPAIPRRRYNTAWALANILRDRQANEEARLGMKPAPMVRERFWLPKRQGEVSELAFCHKAAGLGFGVAKPWGESEPYDFILDSGHRLWRVQVKSACHHFNRRYDVHAQHCNSDGGKTGYTSADIDILVAYLIPINLWYVIPGGKAPEGGALLLPVWGRPSWILRGLPRSLECDGARTIGGFVPTRNGTAASRIFESAILVISRSRRSRLPLRKDQAGIWSVERQHRDAD
jgi:PD-(D/E)XK endonuclease